MRTDRLDQKTVLLKNYTLTGEYTIGTYTILTTCMAWQALQPDKIPTSSQRSEVHYLA
jgi:hypothetical protein